MAHVFRDDGVFLVSVVITDADGASATAAATAEIVNAVPQILSFTGPGTAARGQSVTFVASFFDAGSADAHVARIRWGDGDVSEVAVNPTSGVRTISASHIYHSGGHYQPAVTIIDADGGSSSLGVELQVAGSRLRQGVLEIAGSAGADTFTVALIRGSVEVFGSVGGVTQSDSYDPAGVERIVALLGSGDDYFTVSSTVAVPVIALGGNGADTITAGGGPAILIGGSGNDALRGGSKRDLIIGGYGADQINGDGGSDVLISGRTIYDGDHAVLAALLAEWNSAGTYLERIERLRSGTGIGIHPLGLKLKQDETVFDDAVADTVWGSNELDWFFIDPTRDQPLDKVEAELNR